MAVGALLVNEEFRIAVGSVRLELESLTRFGRRISSLSLYMPRSLEVKWGGNVLKLGEVS